LQKQWAETADFGGALPARGKFEYVRQAATKGGKDDGMKTTLSKAKLSFLRSFHQKKRRQAEGMFLCEGWHLLEEALAVERAIRCLVVDDSRIANAELSALWERAADIADSVYVARTDQMGQLCETKQSQGVAFLCDRLTLEQGKLEGILHRSPCRLALLDEVGDPGNCGMILRSADWFGLDAVALGEGCAELENGKTVRSSMGAVFRVPSVQNTRLPQFLELLKAKGFAVVETALDAKDNLFAYDWPDRCALLVGNEARGVSPIVSKCADTSLLIPQFGGGESLNAGIAASIAMAEWRRKG